MIPLILIRGGGDLASGVALRLHRTGYKIAILELEKPLAVVVPFRFPRLSMKACKLSRV